MAMTKRMRVSFDLKMVVSSKEEETSSMSPTSASR